MFVDFRLVTEEAIDHGKKHLEAELVNDGGLISLSATKPCSLLLVDDRIPECFLSRGTWETAEALSHNQSLLTGSSPQPHLESVPAKLYYCPDKGLSLQPSMPSLLRMLNCTFSSAVSVGLQLLQSHRHLQKHCFLHPRWL